MFWEARASARDKVGLDYISYNYTYIKYTSNKTVRMDVDVKDYTP
jgi:hypothetical protein